MRVSTGMIFDAGVSTINKQTASLLHLQQQVANGRRILSPSDDPVAAARALEVTQSRDIVAQFKENHNNANSALGLEEAHLSSASDLLARVRELAVQAGNTSLSNSDRRAITAELRARFEELTGIANATDGSGQYIFSGFMGATKPVGGNVDAIISGNLAAIKAGNPPNVDVVYSGDDGQRRLQVSPTRFLEVSDSGNDVFNRIRSGNGYFTTNYPIDPSTLKGSNTGTGMIDAGSITDPVAWNASNKNVRIQFTVDNSSPPVTYYDIIDGASNTSLLHTPDPGDDTYPLAPTPLPGVAGLRVYHSGQPIILKNQAGEWATFDYGASVTISGDPATTVSNIPISAIDPDGVIQTRDSFTIAPSSSQSVFKTIANLIGAMESAGTGTGAVSANLANDIGFALTNLDQATDNILRVRAQIGSRMSEIDSLSSVNEDLNLQYQQTLSQLQDLDYAKAISDLTRNQIDLEAAQKSFLTSSKLSLFNFI